MKSQSQANSPGLLYVATLLASTFLMGSSFIAGKVLLGEGFPPLLLAGWRFLVAALVTLPIVFLTSENPGAALFPTGTRPRAIATVALIGLLQTAGVMGLLFLSMRSISASSAAILLFTNPIWVALIGCLIFKEHLTGTGLLGLALGIVGVTLAIGVGGIPSTSHKGHIGEILGLGSAFCWAVATHLNKRSRLAFNPWALSFWQMLVGSVALLLVAYGSGDQWPENMRPQQWAWFFWLAIPASAGSFGLWFVALRKGGATTTSSYLFLAPAFTVVLSYLVLEVEIGWGQGLGGILIGTSLWLVNSIPGAIKR